MLPLPCLNALYWAGCALRQLYIHFSHFFFIRFHALTRPVPAPLRAPRRSAPRAREWNTEKSANAYYLPSPRYVSTQFTEAMLRCVHRPFMRMPIRFLGFLCCLIAHVASSQTRTPTCVVAPNRYIDVPLTNCYKDQIDEWIAEYDD